MQNLDFEIKSLHVPLCCFRWTRHVHWHSQGYHTPAEIQSPIITEESTEIKDLPKAWVSLQNHFGISGSKTLFLALESNPIRQLTVSNIGCSPKQKENSWKQKLLTIFSKILTQVFPRRKHWRSRKWAVLWEGNTTLSCIFDQFICFFFQFQLQKLTTYFFLEAAICWRFKLSFWCSLKVLHEFRNFWQNCRAFAQQKNLNLDFT